MVFIADNGGGFAIPSVGLNKIVFQVVSESNHSLQDHRIFGLGRIVYILNTIAHETLPGGISRVPPFLDQILDLQNRYNYQEFLGDDCASPLKKGSVLNAFLFLSERAL